MEGLPITVPVLCCAYSQILSDVILTQAPIQLRLDLRLIVGRRRQPAHVCLQRHQGLVSVGRI
jgi:hypothetical protein